MVCRGRDGGGFFTVPLTIQSARGVTNASRPRLKGCFPPAPSCSANGASGGKREWGEPSQNPRRKGSHAIPRGAWARRPTRPARDGMGLRRAEAAKGRTAVPGRAAPRLLLFEPYKHSGGGEGPHGSTDGPQGAGLPRPEWRGTAQPRRKAQP